jgi:protein-S-isoprenylcysteine O-methyltransferase Ste14
MVVPGTVVAVVPALILRYTRSAECLPPGAWRLLGLAPLILGVMAYLWCAVDFVRRGLGTPNPLDPPRRLVVAGPYRWCRNPMYVAVVLMLIGECLLWPRQVMLNYLAGTLVFIALMVMAYEEPHLRRVFGDDYAAYCRSTRRFLPLPRRKQV